MAHRFSDDQEDTSRRRTGYPVIDSLSARDPVVQGGGDSRSGRRPDFNRQVVTPPWDNARVGRYRLYPTDEQTAGLVEHCAHARFCWNLALEQWECWWPGRPHAPGYVAQSRQLT